MILCVTLNPCLDKTLEVPPWQPGDSVRGRAMSEAVGGKGNNVARALRRLGRPSCPVTFLGGAVGARCRELLKAEGFDPLLIDTQAPTREIVTVRTQSSAEQTAFFDPDPAISKAEAQSLCDVVAAALATGTVEALTLSGSSPTTTTNEVFSELIAVAQARRTPVFLDTYGRSLASIWGFWPTVMQLNRREAAERLGAKAPTDAELFALLDQWGRHGVRLALVTDGANPVQIMFDGRRYRAIPPPIEVVNPIGSGDSLLGGLVDAWLNGKEPLEIVRHGVACAVANALVWDAGAIGVTDVDRFEPTIAIEPV
jgi:tagatose 6-phosphate kinase